MEVTKIISMLYLFYNMKCIKNYIMSGFPRLGFVMKSMKLSEFVRFI